MPRLIAVALALLSATSTTSAEVVVSPARIDLSGSLARAQLLVSSGANAAATDRTRIARFTSSDPAVVTVDANGRLLAASNGSATITIAVDGVTKTVPVTVSGVTADPVVSFVDDVMPVLSRAGCNMGACHAAQYGQGGFKLSVFGFAPSDDHKAIVRDAARRRANYLNPEESLLLAKPTLAAPHEGGRRLDVGSVDYRLLRSWLAAGAPGPDPKTPELTGLEVEPARRVGTVGLEQQLRVTATYADGRTRDVTALTRFESMDEAVLKVAADGVVRAVGQGQAAALARFEGRAVIATFVVPVSPAADLAGWVENNFIDRFAAAKFREVGLTPSPLCDDATFLRRAYLDATGTLPSVERARAFLASTDPAKRTKLVDELLGFTSPDHTNAYAAWWALKWADVLKVNSNTIGPQGMWAMSNWLKASFRENKPFDKFVRELVTAKGSTFNNGPANFFRIASNSTDLAETVSQLFLGVRLQCAKCHHHPYETLGQADFYGFAAFFSRFSVKTSQDHGLFGGEQVIVVRAAGEVSHPRTGKILPPTPLYGKPAAETTDRRQALADWLTAPDNRMFARNVANRYFGALLGRGLVEPVDDVRDTNPPTNPELLDALAEDFVKSGFNLKHLLRTIMTSRLYQLDSQPTRVNVADRKFYSHYAAKRIAAEALLDAVDTACGTQTKFEKLPLGTRAIELPDATYQVYFLQTFGKPQRKSVCDCERETVPNLAQALHTLNGDAIAGKITDPAGRVAKLLAAKVSTEQAVEELFLAALSRHPTPAERAEAVKLRAEAPSEKVFLEDLLWALLNSKHFLFVR